MLRLEKGKNREIKVSLRDRKTRFNKTLFYGIAIALAIHLGGASLIRIKTSSSHDQQMLPFTIVEAPLAKQDGISEAFLERKSTPAHPLEPSLYEPHLPDIAYRHVLHPIEPLKEKSNIDSFLVMEQDRLESLKLSTTKSLVTEPMVQVLVSGELAENELLFDGIDSLKATLMVNLLKSSGTTHRVLFNVQVENRTGIIFWFAPKLASKSQSFNHFAEHILDEMRFKSSVDGFITTGEVEIVFLFPDRSEA